MLADGKPQTRPAEAAGDAGVLLRVGFEDVLQEFLADPLARIGNGKMQPVLVIFPLTGHADGNGAACGELDAVAQQVEQDLPQALVVAMQAARHVLVDAAMPVEPFLLHLILYGHMGEVQDVLQDEVAVFQHHLAGLDL